MPSNRLKMAPSQKRLGTTDTLCWSVHRQWQAFENHACMQRIYATAISHGVIGDDLREEKQ